MVNQVLLVRAKYLIPMTTEENGKLTRIEDGYILSSEDIIEVGKYEPDIGNRIIDEYGTKLKIIGNQNPIKSADDIQKINGVILPGFVKGHGHDHESALIGVARDVHLTDWLDQAVNIFTGLLHEKEEELTKELGKSPYLIAYLKARLDDISFGITTAMTHHCNFNKYHVSELVEANEKAGTRIYIGVGSQDRNYDSRILDTPQEAVQRLDDLEDKHGHLTRTIIIPGPDQLFSNGPELLKALKKWSNSKNKLIHIHSSEEPGTTKWFIEKYGQTPIEYADSIEFLDDKSLLAHQVNNTENDLQIISKSKAMVVHNPLANTILGSGMPPILKMLELNIPVSFSTDGSGSADNQNMIAAGRLASQYQKALNQDATVIDAELVLRKLTSDPAKMLKVNAGKLKKGKDADFIIFDLNKPSVNPVRKETVIENIIWAASGNEISHVIANGKVLLDDYNFQTLNFNEVISDIQKLADIFEKHKSSITIKSETGARSD